MVAFFKRKAVSQWNEPTYGAFTMTRYMLEPKKWVTEIYYGKWNERIRSFLNQYQVAIYFGVLGYYIRLLQGKKEVEEYLNSLHCKIEEHLLTPADYYPTKEGSYSVRLRIIESGVSIVDLSINVPNLAAAQSVCESWPYKYQNVYDKIMEELL